MERCHDRSCGFENRIEYCEQQTDFPNGGAQTVIDTLDGLLYDHQQIGSRQYSWQINGDAQRSERSFSVLHGDFLACAWPLTETVLSISHELDKKSLMSSYEIEVNWVVRHDIDGLAETNWLIYDICRYANGTIIGTVEQRDFRDGSYRQLPITSYDYCQLLEAMALVNSSQSAERADDARVIAA